MDLPTSLRIEFNTVRFKHQVNIEVNKRDKCPYKINEYLASSLAK